MSEDALIGMAAIVFTVGFPVIVGILVFVGWLVNNNRKHGQALRSQDMFERLARDKLDVIKTAIAMGQSDDQIRELDSRLERLLGADKMAAILDPRAPKAPQVTAELLDNDLLSEVDRMEELRRKQKT